MRKLMAVLVLSLALVGCSDERLYDKESDEREYSRPTAPERVCEGQVELDPAIGCVEPDGPGTTVTLDNGREVLIHGPDPEDRRPAQALASAPARPPVCSTDNRIVFLYASIAGRTSTYAESVPIIRSQVAEMNGVLNEEALETGGVNADFKVRCDDSGQVFVGSVVSPGPDFSSVIEAVAAAGYDESTEKYEVFVDDSSQPYCGIGEVQLDDSKSTANKANLGPMYAMNERNCWIGRTAMHELGHNLGVVQPGTPDGSGDFHCDGSAEDVMCYNDGGATWDSGHECVEEEQRQHFDYCHNDYFHAGQPTGYLADHFNVATESLFIQLGGSAPPPPPPPPPPPSTETFSGVLRRLDEPKAHTFTSGTGSISSTLTCTRSKRTKILPYVRHEVVSGNVVVASEDVPCSGTPQAITAAAPEPGSYSVRVTKVAGAPQSNTRYDVAVTHP